MILEVAGKYKNLNYKIFIHLGLWSSYSHFTIPFKRSVELRTKVNLVTKSTTHLVWSQLFSHSNIQGSAYLSWTNFNQQIVTKYHYIGFWKRMCWSTLKNPKVEELLHNKIYICIYLYILSNKNCIKTVLENSDFKVILGSQIFPDTCFTKEGLKLLYMRPIWPVWIYNFQI